MRDKFIMLSIMLKTLLSDEQGQDLIEYALVVSLISFGAVAGMQTFATDISQTFTSVGTTFTSATA